MFFQTQEIVTINIFETRISVLSQVFDNYRKINLQRKITIQIYCFICFLDLFPANKTLFFQGMLQANLVNHLDWFKLTKNYKITTKAKISFKLRSNPGVIDECITNL